MAGGMDLGNGGKGGKKALDAAINLVPFIDLMAVTIVFLIMTAVWTQLGRLQVSQAGGDPTQQVDPPPETLQPVALLITEKEMKLSQGGVEVNVLPIKRDGKDRLDTTSLAESLTKAKESQPEQNAITLNTEDGVRYEDLVRIIDACIGNKFPSVSVAPAST